jgi:hypothetical protein
MAYTYARRGSLVPILVVAYLVVGVVVAAVNDYFQGVGTVREVLSAALAVLVWPLLLVGLEPRIG